MRDEADARAFAAAAEDVRAVLDDVEARLSPWRPEGELTRFNASPSTEPFPVSPDTAALARAALALSTETGGALDPTLGPVLSLWGLDGPRARATVPTDDEIAAARALTGPGALRVEGDALVKGRPGARATLTAIADGDAADRVYALLVARGFPDVLVDVAGEVRAGGRAASGAPWRVGVQAPAEDADEGDVVLSIPLADRALSTSGTYRGGRQAGAVRYAHVVDPRTGRPVTHDLVSVTVLAETALVADGLSTAALVLGADAAREVLAGRPGAEALFLRRAGDGAVRVEATSGFPLP